MSLLNEAISVLDLNGVKRTNKFRRWTLNLARVFDILYYGMFVDRKNAIEMTDRSELKARYFVK